MYRNGWILLGVSLALLPPTLVLALFTVAFRLPRTGVINDAVWTLFSIGVACYCAGIVLIVVGLLRGGK